MNPYLKINQGTTKEMVIPMGPAASQVAIKQLGTNGGGFFAANSAHPFENPNPVSNFLEMLAILLIPAALCYTFGVMVKDTRTGWMIFSVMLIIAMSCAFFIVFFEQGNLEGKETRFGVTSSALWSSMSTATANGSVNSLLEFYDPLSKLVTLWLMQTGEIIFGGVGSGLYGMFIFLILTIFIAGLMVGRTPEYLGKKIEVFELKMAAMVLLVLPLSTLGFTAISLMTQEGGATAHRFTETLYAFSSMTKNNGSALTGLPVNTVFYNTLGGLAMLMGRYLTVIPILAMAGALANKKIVPSSIGTLDTNAPAFSILLIVMIIVLVALSFFPALALGPMVEHFIQRS